MNILYQAKARGKEALMLLRTYLEKIDFSLYPFRDESVLPATISSKLLGSLSHFPNYVSLCVDDDWTFFFPASFSITLQRKFNQMVSKPFAFVIEIKKG